MIVRLFALLVTFSLSCFVAAAETTQRAFGLLPSSATSEANRREETIGHPRLFTRKSDHSNMVTTASTGRAASVKVVAAYLRRLSVLIVDSTSITTTESLNSPTNLKNWNKQDRPLKSFAALDDSRSAQLSARALARVREFYSADVVLDRLRWQYAKLAP